MQFPPQAKHIDAKDDSRKAEGTSCHSCHVFKSLYFSKTVLAKQCAYRGCAHYVSIKPEWCIFSLKTLFLYIFAAEECHEVTELIYDNNNNTNNAAKSATTGPL